MCKYYGSRQVDLTHHSFLLLTREEQRVSDSDNCAKYFKVFVRGCSPLFDCVCVDRLILNMVNSTCSIKTKSV